MSFLKKFLGDANQKELSKLQPLVDQINNLEEEIKKLSDDQIKEKTEEFKKRIKEGTSLDDLLPEAFALVREASQRTLHQRHFDVQLVSGICLHQGKIAEMKTGEGKTLSSTLPIYLNALAGKGVHVITVNDYLARRDANWMGPVYESLGLTCGCVQHDKAFLYEPQLVDENEVTVEMENLKESTRAEAYQADITYGTNNEFGFDYLRDNMAQSSEQMVQRDLCFAVIDEVDSVLIDEARTPLIISAPDAESTQMYGQFSKLVTHLKKETDYAVDEKMKAVTLTEEGIAKVEKMLGMGNIYQEGGIRYVHHLEQALRAQVIFQKDKDYVVKGGQVIIVDDFTGRLMPGRRYSGGLHQALEAKEGVAVQQESRTLASITFQNYFRMYEKLSGMTGTALTSAEEFHKVYGLDVLAVPTNRPMLRQDLSDSIYKNEQAKFKAVVETVKKYNQKNQPVLIGTVSIEKNELLSAMLQKEGIQHQILNAKHHEKEAQIISQAGRKGAVTVATNMAGRGVDIVLGGRQEDELAWQKEHDEVIEAGGLAVIGTERHEARRIDDQLRGRAGRQGDPGSSQFFVSLEDDLMRVFGGDKIGGVMERFNLPEDQPIENKMVSRAIESAQAKIEGYNFDARKHVLEYDDVLNKQREVVYRRRCQALKEEDISEQVQEMIENEVDKILQYHATDPNYDNWEIDEISKIFKSLFNASDEQVKKIKDIKEKDLLKTECLKIAKDLYRAKEAEMNKKLAQENSSMRRLEKFVLLRVIDMLWMDHLDTMDHLRDSVRLRAYGQKNPLVEYKNEGHRLFQKLLSAIETNVTTTLFKAGTFNSPQKQEKVAEKQKGDIGRNDPCPCGSGKKYKKCCGKE